MKSNKNLKELREQLQEDIITILSNSHYDYLNQSKKQNVTKHITFVGNVTEICSHLFGMFLCVGADSLAPAAAAQS